MAERRGSACHGRARLGSVGGFLLGAGAIVVAGPAGAPWLAAAWLWLAIVVPRASRLAAGAGLASLLVGAALVDGAAARLPAGVRYEGMIEGRVVDVRRGPRNALIGATFEVEDCDPGCAFGRVRLGFHDHSPPVLNRGERWRIPVRLRAPSAPSNPGRADPSRSSWRAGLHALGYARGPAQRLAPAPPLSVLARLRSHALERLAPLTGGGLLSALLLGARDQLDARTWRALAASGTTHLFVVSGLHVTLVAGAVLGLLRLCGRSIAAPGSALAALLVAGCFGVLSGFEEPVRRALGMLGLLLWARVRLRHTALLLLLGRALCAVLVLDPLAALDAGLALSALAVVALALVDRAAAGSSAVFSPERLGNIVRPQLVITAVLAVALTGIFGWFPPASVLINIVAVPVVGMLVLPVALAALLLGLGLGVEAAFGVLEGLGAMMMTALDAVSGHAWRHAVAAPGALLLLTALAAALLVAAALPTRVRLAAALALALALSATPPPPPAGSFSVHVLDVGQGLSVLVRTARHALLYDSGPSYPRTGTDAGETIVVPALRALGVERLDRVLISHGDADHIGGLASVRAAFGSAEVLAPASVDGAQRCSAPRRWLWDGVEFAVLHPGGRAAALVPAAPEGGSRRATGRSPRNDTSCVLAIRALGGGGEGDGRGRALLPGDVGVAVERRLVPSLGAMEFVVAPHHGSQTSSGRALVRAAHPRWVIFAAASPSPFGHPHEDVRARWHAAGARTVTTGSAGLVSWRSDRPERVRCHGASGLGWWRRDPEQVDGAAACVERAQPVPGSMPR